MDERRAGVLGATSLVGGCLLQSLTKAGWSIMAFTRRIDKHSDAGITWHSLPFTANANIPYWVCVVPIWIVPNYFSLFEASGARRVVVTSSTSRFTKIESSNDRDRAVAAALVNAEDQFCTWAENRGIEWIILRPTMIYGLGQDANISQIAKFIRRFKFFPIVGGARGLRQPVYAEDVADACLAVLGATNAKNQAYNLSGGETLTYHQMVSRVFLALGQTPRFLNIPLVVLQALIACVRLLPSYRHWSSAMAERMGKDLIFDHSNAVQDFDYSPREFSLEKKDLPLTLEQEIY